MISFYTQALLLLRRPPCWKKHGTARTIQHDTARRVPTRSTRRACRIVTCRGMTQQVEFGLKARFFVNFGYKMSTKLLYV